MAQKIYVPNQGLVQKMPDLKDRAVGVTIRSVGASLGKAWAYH